MERGRTRNATLAIAAVCCAIVVGLTLGCGKSEPNETSGAVESTAKPTVASNTPDQAIHEFMMAFKNGDDAKAAELLSEKARQEVARTEKAISPPGSKTMQFKVGDVEYVADSHEAAHVACQISDVDPDGQESKYDVVWFLRKESAGWRVAGVAMKIFPDELPVLYNFEDQDDMDRKMQLVEQEMVRRAQGTLLQAQQTPDSETRKQ